MVFHVLKPFSDLTKKEKVTIAKGFNKIGIYNGFCLISNRTYYFVVNAAIKLITFKASQYLSKTDEQNSLNS